MNQIVKTLSDNSDHIQYFVSKLESLLQLQEAIKSAIDQANDKDRDADTTQANITRIQIENAINSHINNQYKPESIEIFKAYRGNMFPTDSIEVDGFKYNNASYLNGVNSVELNDESITFIELKYEELKQNLINNQEFRESYPEWYYRGTITDELGAIALGTIVDTYLNEGAGKLVPGGVPFEQQMNIDVASYMTNEATNSTELYKRLYQEFDGSIGDLLVALMGTETRDDRLTDLLASYSYVPSDQKIALDIASMTSVPPDTDFSKYDRRWQGVKSLLIVLKDGKGSSLYL